MNWLERGYGEQKQSNKNNRNRLHGELILNRGRFVRKKERRLTRIREFCPVR